MIDIREEFEKNIEPLILENIKIIEINKSKALELADELPNALVVHGDGRDVELLLEENIEDMDVFIAATESPETNIMTCLVAKSKKVNKTIALAENVDYSKLSHSIGIDTIINKKIKYNNKILHQSKLVNYFNGDYAKSKIEEDLNKFPAGTHVVLLQDCKGGDSWNSIPTNHCYQLSSASTTFLFNIDTCILFYIYKV